MLLWWSDRNCRWFAIVLRPTSHPVGDEMLEAATPAELEQRLAAAGVQPVHPQQVAPEPAPVQRPVPTPPPPRPVLRPVYGRHEAPRPPWWRRVVGAFVQLDNEW